MSEPIFTNWGPEHTKAWGNAPLRLRHRLHQHPLYQMEALAELIERYPRQQYALVHMGAQKERRLWREGEIGSMSGQQVIEAIARGRMWLNLRNVGEVDKRYKEILDQIFEEVAANVPGYHTYARTCGILISSPRAQVYYHIDLPGQSLWQIHGEKRVFLYPDKAPFLTPEQLEHITLYEVEVDVPFEPWYDAHAQVFEIGGGEMLHWPLNAPHRVENLDCLSVSMTTEYWTEAIRRRQMLNMGNGILRDKLGLHPRSVATSGPAFWAKAALQASVRRSGLLKRARKARRPVEFRLDDKHPGQVIDIPARAS